jgi:hypothetical protein
VEDLGPPSTTEQIDGPEPDCQQLGGHTDHSVRRRLPPRFGEAEKSDSARQGKRGECASGQRGRNPPKPRRTTDQDEQRESKRDAGLDQERRANQRYVVIAMDIEVGVADPTGDQRQRAIPIRIKIIAVSSLSKQEHSGQPTGK